MILVATLIGCIYLIMVSAWVCGAFYFDLGKESGWGILACIAWIGFVVFTLTYSVLYSSLIVTGALLVVLIWWFSQKPSLDREWDPNFSKPCRIRIHGDLIEVDNIRNTEYRSLTDYDLKYENRVYRAEDLQGADVLILFWGSSLLSHPMMIFDFGNNQHLCFSVEVRYRANQNYSFLKGIYRQYELMYVVTDERDAILRRTRYAENQDCYLYRLRADQPGIQQLFREYADAANELATHPRWYHAITDNCTTTIIKRRVEKVQFDLRFYMNGALDKLLYERELIDTSLSFSELKARSHINESANSATPEEFSQAIRMNLPGYESREFEH